jgi:hypothetical protein
VWALWEAKPSQAKCEPKSGKAFLHLMALLCVKIPIFLPWENQSFTNKFWESPRRGGWMMGFMKIKGLT